MMALTYRRRWVSIVAVFLAVLIPVGWNLVNWLPATSTHDAAAPHLPAAVISQPPSTVRDMSEESAAQEEPAESAGDLPTPTRAHATPPRLPVRPMVKSRDEQPRRRQWTAVQVVDITPEITPASWDQTGEPDSESFASNNSAIFIPDSNRADAGLRVMRIADDGARNYHVRPSPDGTSVAFDSDRGGTRGIFVANRDGTNVHRVSGPGYAALPTWSPDGGRIAFVKADDRDDTVWNLWILELATGALRQVSFHGAGRTSTGSWFPDGHRICYSHESRLLIVDLTTGDRREFTSPRGRVGAATVSPNGRRIVFKAGGGGTWLLNLEQGGDMRRILDDPSAEEFSWAPEGDRLAYFSRRENNWVMWVEVPR
jgi:dipeptidyl aminopeptidase/acylaminoacyl peptidase